jgi:hypothetical protein
VTRLWWRKHAPTYLRATLALSASVGLAVSAFLVVGPALAGPAGAPGVNATVKIHDDEPEPDPEIQNQPHVCTFHVHGFNFDEGETGVWWIQGWPPTGGPPDADSANAVMGPEPYVAVEDDGSNAFEWRTTERTLPDGHYKLFVEQRHDSSGGHVVVTYKHKVFWVECAAATLSPTPSPTRSVGGGTASSSPSMGSETESASPSGSGSVAGATGTPGGEQSVQGATGTPGQVPNTAVPGGGGGPAMTWLFAAILALSLGTLGCLNLVAARRRR